MYEIITKHNNWGNAGWVEEDQFFEDLNRFIDANPDMNLRDYGSVLDEYSLEWSAKSIECANYEKMDGRGVMALLVAAYRGDHMCNGYFAELLEKGLIQKWIARLEELDSMKGEIDK